MITQPRTMYGDLPFLVEMIAMGGATAAELASALFFFGENEGWTDAFLSGTGPALSQALSAGGDASQTKAIPGIVRQLLVDADAEGRLYYAGDEASRTAEFINMFLVYHGLQPIVGKPGRYDHDATLQLIEAANDGAISVVAPLTFAVGEDAESKSAFAGAQFEPNI